MNSAANNYDVLIAGGGPAGSACALALAGSGLKIAILEKHSFPRDKICGDAIGGRVKKILHQINPQLSTELESFSAKTISAGWKLVAPNGKTVELLFTNYGYVSKRIDFDHFLFKKAQQTENVTCLEEFSISKILFSIDGVEVISSSGESVFGKVIVGCDGAHSAVVRNTIGKQVDPRHYSAAVRSYYSNIADVKENIIEIHLSEKFLPGYFWIFPLKDNISNVGFGMLSKDIAKRKIDLKKAMIELIDSNQILRKRFADAKMESPLEGFGLPLGGVKHVISGNRFLLCGDAASLIDPLNGEGIGNAMWSAQLAAKQIIRCFQKNIFSSDFMQDYEEEINKKIVPELKKKLKLQKLFNRKWLINSLVSAASRSQWLRKLIGKNL